MQLEEEAAEGEEPSPDQGGREGGRGAAAATVLHLPRSNLGGWRRAASATALPPCPCGQIWEVGEGSHHRSRSHHCHRPPTVVLRPNPRRGEGRRSEGEVEVRGEEEGGDLEAAGDRLGERKRGGEGSRLFDLVGGAFKMSNLVAGGPLKILTVKIDFCRRTS